jgi:4-amino-4-deoxy-L-arabinose transferase-like glycosyltransferase
MPNGDFCRRIGNLVFLPSPISNLTGRRFLVLLLLAAFVVRLGALVALRNPRQFHGMQAGHDAVEFNALGLNLADGKGYTITPGRPTSFRAPGFPIFLAALYSLSYANYLLVYLALCSLGAATCGILLFLSRELLTEDQARIGAILATLYFPAIYLGTLFLSETLFAFCLAIGLLAFLRHLKSESLFYAVTAGIALGWGTLTRPFAMLLLPAFIGLLIAAGKRTRRLSVLPLAAFGLAFLSVIVPWTIRNYSVFHHFVLIATNGGSTFYGGNNDRVLRDPAYWGGWISTVYLPGRQEIDRTTDEVSHDRVEWELGKRWVRGHLLDMPFLCALKVTRFWLPDISSQNRKFVILDAVGYTPFLILFLAAFIRHVRSGQFWNVEWLCIHLVLLSTIVTALVFWGSPRFRDGIYPVMILYAASLPGLTSPVGLKTHAVETLNQRARGNRVPGLLNRT